MIRLLLVEDEPAVRQGLRMLLAAEADLCVVGEAADASRALDLALSLRPDVVLMDVEMPNGDGITAAGALRLTVPETAVIMLSIHDDAFTCARAHEVGAVAFVSKSLPADVLLTAIRQASQAGCALRKEE